MPNTTYYYSVRSKDTVSNSSLAISDRYSFITKKEVDKTAPETPKFLRARSSSSDIIDLAWSAVKDKDIVKYNVYRDNALISTAFNNNYRDNNLSPNTSYTYAVSAIDESGNESDKMTVTQEMKRKNKIVSKLFQKVQSAVASVLMFSF